MSKEFTVEELEKLHMYPDDGRVPHVPFGFNHQAWLRFKSQIKPGDKIFAFESSQESWEHLAGRAGYELVRDEEVIASIITRMN